MRYSGAKRFHRFRAISLTLLMAVMLSACIYRPLPSNQPRTIGTVTAATGTPVVIRYNEQYIVGVQSQIYEGDILQTDADSRAQIRMIDRSVISLGNNSHLVFHKYTYVTGANRSTAEMTFTSGVLELDSTDQATERTPDFLIQTPLANLHVQSTGLLAGFSSNDKRLDLLLLHGKDVEITNDQGSVKLDRVNYGTSIVAGGTPRVPAAWTPEKRERLLRATTL